MKKYLKQLRAIQKHSKKSQTEIAGLLGVSFPTVNSWLHEKSIPRKKAQERIESLYFQYTGDLNLGKAVLLEKKKHLGQLRERYQDPFGLILKRKDLYENFLLEMTYHTNSIEGSTFNEPQVRAVLFHDVTIPHKSVREHQEVKNHQAALGFLMRYLRDDSKIITEELILRLHEILMNGILHNAGQYRTHPVRISGSSVVTSNYLSIEKHIKSFVSEVNKKPQDIVTHMAITHALFERIHPFSDGNGRVGMLLLIALAYKNNLAPVLITQDKKMAYYNFLQESQNKENHTPLTSFLYDAIFNGYELLD